MARVLVNNHLWRMVSIPCCCSLAMRSWGSAGEQYARAGARPFGVWHHAG
jgi:hypothetical protein